MYLLGNSSQITNSFNEASSIFLPQIRCLKLIFLIIFFLAGFETGFGQSDSLNKADTTLIHPVKTPVSQFDILKKREKDSIHLTQKDSQTINERYLTRKFLHDSLVADSIQKVAIAQKPALGKDTASYRKFQIHPYLPFDRAPAFMIIDYHRKVPKDELFYLMMGLIFLLAFTRTVFSKYVKNLFLLFFQTSLRQKQTRDQLLQNNLASLFTNLLFFISTGLYISLLIQYKNWAPVSFWKIAVFSGLVLVVIYLGKYLFLLFSGWVFNTREAANAYIFLVFMVNKVMGILIIPFLLVLAFAKSGIVDIALTISFVLIAILYLYRYLVSFGAIRNKLKVNALHFFLYLCAVEVLPLFLIYKGLIKYIAGSF